MTKKVNGDPIQKLLETHLKNLAPLGTSGADISHLARVTTTSFSKERHFYEEFTEMLRRVFFMNKENIIGVELTDECLKKIKNGWFQYSIKIKAIK